MAGVTPPLAVSASPVTAVTTKTPRAARAAGAVPAAAGAADRPEDKLLTRVLQAVDVCFARIYHRVTVLSPQRLPKAGPAILICNHVSGLDPLLIQAVCPRLIVWMMAKEYYEIRALKWIFEQIHAIPVGRGGRDLAATRAALRALENGHVLGVFPEGRIEPTRDLLPFQVGVAMMAIKADVPVYPAYLDGTQRGKSMFQAFFYPNHASLAFGPRVEFPRSGTSREVLQQATDRFAEAVAGLKAQWEPKRPGR